MLGSWHPCLCMKPVHAHELHKWQRSEVVLGLSNANTALRPKDRLDRPEAMKGNMHIFPSSNSECLSFIFVHFPRICGLYNDCFIYICVHTYNYMYIYIYVINCVWSRIWETLLTVVGGLGLSSPGIPSDQTATRTSENITAKGFVFHCFCEETHSWHQTSPYSRQKIFYLLYLFYI